MSAMIATFQGNDHPTAACAINGAGQAGFIRSPEGSITSFQVPQMKQADGVVLRRCMDAAGHSSVFLRMH